MLAQSFQSAADLGISEPQKEALMKTLVLLETGKLVHATEFNHDFGEEAFSGHFNMAHWKDTASCGTVCCIGGTAELIGGVDLSTTMGADGSLQELFCPSDVADWKSVTPAQAARALRSYLTTGDAKWTEAVSVSEPSS